MNKISKRLLCCVILATLILTLGVTVSAANTDSRTVNLTATIDPTTTVAVSTTTIAFGNTNPLTANYTKSVDVTVQSNATYKLTVYATDDFKTADATPKVFAINNLGVKLRTDGSYQTMSKLVGTPVILANSQPATASKIYNVDLQLSTQWLNAVPGNYTTSLVFAATQI